MFNKKSIVIFALLVTVFSALLIKLKISDLFNKKQEVIPKIKVDRGGYLVSDNIGYVPNVLSWGFNRHICYDKKYRNWWIFYYKSNNKVPPWIPSESYIVYKYSTDNGKHWSSEIKLDKGSQAADFTIDCSPPYINIAYGDVYNIKEYQSKVFWKKGEMQRDKIRWFVSSVVMKSDPQRAYTRVIPSIVYYNGNPAVSVHDQSQQGSRNGHQKVYVALSKDPDGSEWGSQTVVFDKKNNKQFDTIPFTSLTLVKNKLVAIINSDQYKLSIAEYLGDNKWSTVKLIQKLNYGGGVPEWSTVNDSEGNLHILYPEQNSSKTIHGVYNGEYWRFETIGTGENNHRTLGISIDHEDNLYAFSEKNIISRIFSKNNWVTYDPLIKFIKPPIDYVTVSEKMIDNKLGVAWSDGDERDPNLWFICLEKDSKSATSFNKCK